MIIVTYWPDSSNNIPAISTPGQYNPVLCINQLYAFILQVSNHVSNTVIGNREIKFIRIGHLPATEPHFTLICLKNIPLVSELDYDTRSFSRTITVETEPINTGD
jgi:hypothetical protein